MFETKKIEFTKLLEKNSYEKLIDFLKVIEKESERNLDYLVFWTMIYDYTLLIEILRHKVSLAIILSEASGVNAIPEDRSRIIYLFGKCADLDFAEANLKFSREFGTCFQIKNNYIVHGKSYSWKTLAIKAKEVKNGLHNYCFLTSQIMVDKIIKYFKMFKINDPKKLLEVDLMARNVLRDFKNNPLLPPSSDQSKPILEKVSQFYLETGRVRLDIEGIKENPDFSKAREYVLMIHFVCQTKLDLSEQKLPIDSTDHAYNMLIKQLGSAKFRDLLGADELERFGKQLQLVKKIVV